MPEHNSFMPASQNSFLAALPETTNNQVITGFDTFALTQFCTPSFFGCKLCIGANIAGGSVTLSVSASTPVGGFSKSFKISNNITFTWNPIGVFKVEFKISNFKKTSHSFSFTATIRVCFYVPIPFVGGWKCASYSHTFSIPTLLPSFHQSLLSAPITDEDPVIEDNSYSLLVLHALLEEKGGCNCHSNE